MGPELFACGNYISDKCVWFCCCWGVFVFWCLYLKKNTSTNKPLNLGDIIIQGRVKASVNTLNIITMPPGEKTGKMLEMLWALTASAPVRDVSPWGQGQNVRQIAVIPYNLKWCYSYLKFKFSSQPYLYHVFGIPKTVVLQVVKQSKGRNELKWRPRKKMTSWLPQLRSCISPCDKYTKAPLGANAA